MLRIIDRYLFLEILSPFFLTLAILLMVLLTDQLLRLIEMLVMRGLQLFIILKVFLLILPTFLVIAIPAAVLMGVIISFNRLSTDHEIVALQAVGVGLPHFLFPSIAFSALAFVVSLGLSVWAQPWAGKSVKGLAVSLLKKQLSVGLEPQTFNEPFDHMVIFIDEMPAPNRMSGIFIHDLRNSATPVLTLAKEGTLFSDPNHQTMGFSLYHGTQYRFKEDEPGNHQRIHFESYDFQVDLEDTLGSQELSIERISPTEIRKALLENPEKASRYRRLLSEYYKNYTFPVSCLVFGLLGVPIGLAVKRAGRLGGFAVGLFLGVVYYFLVFISDFLGVSGTLNPSWAVWLPNLILLVVSLILIMMAHRRMGVWGR